MYMFVGLCLYVGVRVCVCMYAHMECTCVCILYEFNMSVKCVSFTYVRKYVCIYVYLCIMYVHVCTVVSGMNNDIILTP